MKMEIKKRKLGLDGVSPDGQPGHGKVDTGSPPRQVFQPGRTHVGKHPKTGTAHPKSAPTTPHAVAKGGALMSPVSKHGEIRTQPSSTALSSHHGLAAGKISERGQPGQGPTHPGTGGVGALASRSGRQPGHPDGGQKPAGGMEQVRPAMPSQLKVRGRIGKPKIGMRGYVRP